ncbi:hypothetical protein FOZ61_003505 [Perkinsus olseni]|uniref:Uncharacterized protein n=1 Tax=Perkinsus olseni TaxID=32597 RepID=A0A7J6KKS4_PEROL|nr:hypothetical protein FOZ61_003505 [Perkinsus olseni]KAF4649347.1 hypothetical protein FOL46_001894 [Perkinsus olseni]
MYLRLSSLYLIFVVAECDSEVFLGDKEDYSGRLGAPIDKTYALNSSSSKEPAIQNFKFTRQQSGRVFITAIKGRLRKGQYDCGYNIANGSSNVTLMDPCRQIVEDSNGYYGDSFLSGCYMSSNNQFLNVPTATVGYDLYQLEK